MPLQEGVPFISFHVIIFDTLRRYLRHIVLEFWMTMAVGVICCDVTEDLFEVVMGMILSVTHFISESQDS